VTGEADILVVGAGPTGLTLAVQAHDHGADVRIVERRTEAFRPSRALILHPRTLEVLRPLRLTDALLERADTSPGVRLHLGRRTVPVRLARFDLADTAFPHLTMLRQADAEAVLARALAERGVTVERGTELVDLRLGKTSARARLRGARGDEEGTFRAVVGCDGVDSTVRSAVGIGWPGGTYDREVVLADLELGGADGGALEPGVAHVAAVRSGLVFLFAQGERATWRLLATRPATGELRPGAAGPEVPTTELADLVRAAGLSADIRSVAWSSRVALQHRIAQRYRHGPVFLAGDAAHASSPAGGTGMNTGIQDGANLGWKLAFAGGNADTEVLTGSYESERRPVARQVLALTHAIFWAESSTDLVASVLRGTLAPLLAPVVPVVLGRRRLVAEGIRLLSQLRVGYPDSPLSVAGSPPRADRIRAGDRLPDAQVTCDGRRIRLHELTAEPGVHLLLDRDADEVQVDPCRRSVRVHRLSDRPGAGVVAVRPDGHVGFCSGGADPGGLRSWLDLIGAPVGTEALA
jgi:2-polyprenyl-6-methoxyphenol hydroxylase-like FAD-dependent oxidoreductase